MADYVTCGRSGFSFETLLQALIVKDDDTLVGQNFINVSLTEVAGTRVTPITCSTKDSFYDLFQRALALDSNGMPKLRVVVVTGTQNDAVCGINESLNEGLRLCFGMNADDEVALMLINTDPVI